MIRSDLYKYKKGSFEYAEEGNSYVALFYTNGVKSSVTKHDQGNERKKIGKNSAWRFSELDPLNGDRIINLSSLFLL